MLSTECSSSIEEASIRLASGEGFAYLPAGEDKPASQAKEVLKDLCTTNRASIIATMKQAVETASLGNPFPAEFHGSKIGGMLFSLYTIFSNLSRYFYYKPSDLSVRLIPPRIGEIDALSLRTFHTDRVEDFFLLHTLSAEGEQEAGTEVAHVEGALYQQLLQLDEKFRVKREESRAGNAERAEVIEIRERMNALVPDDCVLRTWVGDTLILRGDDLPTFHRGPDHRMKRVLVGMPNLTLRG